MYEWRRCDSSGVTQILHPHFTAAAGVVLRRRLHPLARSFGQVHPEADPPHLSSPTPGVRSLDYHPTAGGISMWVSAVVLVIAVATTTPTFAMKCGDRPLAISERCRRSNP